MIQNGLEEIKKSIMDKMDSEIVALSLQIRNQNTSIKSVMDSFATLRVNQDMFICFHQKWIVDVWNSGKGTTGLLCLIENVKRHDEWFIVLKSYYCVKYSEKVNKYTNPKKSKSLVDDTSGMYLCEFVKFYVQPSLY